MCNSVSAYIISQIKSPHIRCDKWSRQKRDHFVAGNPIDKINSTISIQTMKLTPIFALAMSVSLVAHAQEAPGQINAQPTKIIGAVSDGRPSPPAPPKALPKFTINWSTVHQKKGHKVIINKVQAPAPIIQHPAEPLDQEKVKQRAREIEKWVEDIQQSGGFFTVSATIYDHRISHVRWWHEGEEYAVFSNVDWNHLGGFHEFVGRGKRYNMFLFSGNVSTRQLRKEIKEGYRSSQPDLPKLPQLSERGAAYMMVKGDEHTTRGKTSL